MKSLPLAEGPAPQPVLEGVKRDTGDFVRRWRSEPFAALRPEGRAAVFALAACIAAAIVLIGLLIDAREPLLAAHLPKQARSLAEIVTRLGLSGYIFALSAAVCAIGLLLRGRGAGPCVDAGLALMSGRAFFVFLTNAVTGVLSQALKHLVGRARPQLMGALGPFHFDLFSLKANLASFPSGHTVTAFATAMAIGFFAPALRIPLYVLAVLVGVSRLVLLAHYPSDVLAGCALGLGVTWLLARAMARRRIVFDVNDGRLRVRGRGVTMRALRDLAQALV